jgi:murein DD-endopeptidase MepM/ murein hydrolase activator NlpD
MNLLAALAALLALVGPAPPAPPPVGPLATPGVRVQPAAVPTPGSGVWPLADTRVVRGFDGPETPWDAAHRGVDLAGAPGEVVHSALAGTIAFAGTVAGRGVVAVDHGGFRTTYEPVIARVTAGDPVERGQPIGVLETAGTHCPPATCLHWGLRVGREYRDPLVLVGARRVRLLPLG